MSKTALSILAVTAYLWWSHARGTKATTAQSVGNPAGTSYTEASVATTGPGNIGNNHILGGTLFA